MVAEHGKILKFVLVSNVFILRNLSNHQMDMQNRGILKFIHFSESRVLAANCLKRQITEHNRFCNGRKVLGKITSDYFNLSHHSDVR